MTKQQLMIQENKELIKAVADVFRAKKEIENREKKLRTDRSGTTGSTETD